MLIDIKRLVLTSPQFHYAELSKNEWRKLQATKDMFWKYRKEFLLRFHLSYRRHFYLNGHLKKFVN